MYYVFMKRMWIIIIIFLCFKCASDYRLHKICILKKTSLKVASFAFWVKQIS